MTTKVPYQLLEDGTDGELITWDASGVIAAVAAGTSGQVLTSNGAGAAPTFQAAAGGGDVSKVGTPVDNQIGVWTGDGTIEGDAALTFDTATNQLLLGGTTSGTTALLAEAVAGTTVLTLPAATDQLVGRATTDTLTNKTFDANGTGNSLSNVDVADLAVGTDGELITWDASGNPTTVAVGSSGEVLTSNGAGAAPTFQAAGGGGGGWTVATFTLSGSGSQVLFSGASGITEIEIMLQGVNLAGTARTIVQLGDAGGYETSGYLNDGAEMDESTDTIIPMPTATNGLILHKGPLDVAGMARIKKEASTNLWVCESVMCTTSNDPQITVSTKTLSGALTQVRLDQTSGSWSGGGTATVRYR